MGLVPFAIVLGSLVAFATSAVLSALSRPSSEWLRGCEPRIRVWWALALLGAPAITGVLAVSLVLGHCATTLLTGSDDCTSMGRVICHLCLAHPIRATVLAQLACAACLVRPALRSVDVTRGFLRSRRAQQRLRQIAVDHPTENFALIPGSDAFVAGWPHGTVFIGEAVADALDAKGIVAVVAHERAHLRRGDAYVRAVARVLAATHLPGSATRFVQALDLAIEQACDRVASVVVSDPAVVARAIGVAASKRPTVPGAIAARIAALRSPRSSARGPIAATVTGAVVAVLLGVTFDHQIHSVAERLALLLAR